MVSVRIPNSEWHSCHRAVKGQYAALHILIILAVVVYAVVVMFAEMLCDDDCKKAKHCTENCTIYPADQVTGYETPAAIFERRPKLLTVN